MIPSILSSQVRRGVEDFLRTTFPISTPFFHGVVDRLIESNGGLFKGPYVSVKLPFCIGNSGPDFFPDVPMDYSPYQHQETAFNRLSGTSPLSTLVATGTGSGKTECFLLPILNHCLQQRRQGLKGIKAIIVYPMNALATDQAKRLAKTINRNPNLHSNVTAGLFIGQKEGHPSQVMTEEWVITDRNTLRLTPPDILLTNYKMLDYLLIRPKDYPIWQENNPETLKYLVVDELHTFDGAQGTDLACLIRRLKARLKTPEGSLCCVGTSATLGGQDNTQCLRNYAEQVFGEKFDANSIVTESLMTANEFLADSFIARSGVVSPEVMERLRPESYSGFSEYIRAQYELWFDEKLEGTEAVWQIALGRKIKEHGFFWKLLMSLNNRSIPLDGLISQFDRIVPEFSGENHEYRKLVMASILAIISAARITSPLPDKPPLPFLNVRYQLWLRELRRIVCSVDNKPELKFSDDLKAEELRNHLPVVHCRECGAMGWGGVKRLQDSKINPDLQSFYQGFFGFRPTAVFLFPVDERGTPGEQQEFETLLCGNCLHLIQGGESKECPFCSSGKVIPIYLPNSRVTHNGTQHGSHDCPYCEGNNSLTILGSRAASLTSVVISQLFSSTYNDDKKLLTFSDSVQDASHRAGFFAARTYRFNLRTAIQKVLAHEQRELSLLELPDVFISFWHARKKQSDFVATFLPPDMEWLQDFEYLVNNGSLPVGSDLEEYLYRRLAWEITSEYGFTSRIGRTLEKTGVSIAALNPDRFSLAVENLLEPLRNEIGGLTGLTSETLGSFIVGILAQLKSKGAVFNPELEQYIENWGNSFLLSRKHHMPNYGRFSRTPVFLTAKRGTRFDTLLSTGRSGRTWYEEWLEKCLGELKPGISDYAEPLYRIVLDGLVASKVLFVKIVQGFPIWGLNPDELLVSREVIQFRCTSCGHFVSAPVADKELWDGKICLRFKCRGRYQQEPHVEDYYGMLYSTGDVERIFAHEHTGLLERDTRERLERRFINGDSPGAPNLLSCTPTLEMGIDIGDLSSVVLCSVPPSQTNYLQRIGRTGRRDGNSFNFTVANGRPHDLYFFAEPEEMLAGMVEPPGCFLDAPAVLERQVTAFCFDSWLVSKQGHIQIPDSLTLVLTNLAKGEHPERFPYNFIQFIEANQDTLIQNFVSMFTSQLSENSIEHLQGFMAGTIPGEEGLKLRILKGLHGIANEVESLKKRVQKLSKTIKKMESDPARDKNFEREINELKIEKSSLHSIIKSIKDKNTYNFFTDEGLLPNYAFPEAGVVLRSIIYRRKTKPDKHGQYDTRTYEYERPSASAIHELAPDNHFYAEGRVVTIDQINMNLSEIEDWRFCTACSYHQLLVTSEETTCCPRCGSTLWSDDGQKKQMLRMRQVIATTNDRKSRSGDDSDDREPEFFSKKMMVDIEEKNISAAFKVEANDFPFGIDFVGKATFREVNFGKRDEFSEKINIAGEQFPKIGFTVCKECGKVQNNSSEIQHAMTCRHRNSTDEKDIYNFLYLYRDFNSEAIRMLLPLASSEGADKKLHSFVSALYIGLKKKFDGNIEHLRTTLFEEPLPDSSIRKRYLVLYDSIPGGTGYLKQLMQDEKPLLDILSASLDILRGCSCNQNPEKDGCYRCIYAYRNNFDRDKTSRNAAIQLLSDILAHRDNFVRTKSLKDISFNPLFESELEAMFIESLKDFEDVHLKQEVVHGKPGWFFSVKGKGYYIEPQVELGASDGVVVSSRADFVIYPEKGRGQKPIVIFTDGFTFHSNRIGKDMAQRMALARCGYRVWSISWEDVDAKLKGQSSPFENYTTPPKYMQLLDAFDAQFGVKKLVSANTASSLELLLQYLAMPDDSLWGTYALVQGLGRVQMPCQEDAIKVAEELLSQTADWNDLSLSLQHDGTGKLLGGLYEDSNEDISPRIKLLASIGSDDYRLKKFSTIASTCRLFDDPELVSKETFRAVWNGFIRMYNVFQFLPAARFITSAGLAAGDYSFLDSETGAPLSDHEELANLKKITDPVAHSLLNLVFENGLPLPEPGFELCNHLGKIVATGELCWPHLKIALLRDDEMDLGHEFTSCGWNAMALVAAISAPDKCLSAIETALKSNQ